MRRGLKRLIAILDGTPPPDGKRQRGQSTVELALVTPIIFILLAGMVEVGWFANNFLILLEASRVGARNATVLEGDQSVLSWDEDFSFAPVRHLNPNLVDRADWPVPSSLGLQDSFYNCRAAEDFFRFYNLVACIVQTSMDPLEIRDGNGAVDSDGNPVAIDDIVISAFAVQMIEDDDGAGTGDMDVPGKSAGFHPVVVGRYPTTANECNAEPDPANPGSIRPIQDSGRDPFDFDVSGGRTVSGVSGANFTELEGFDAINSWEGGVSSVNVPERQRGYVWRGQHLISDNSACVGSEFTIDEIEELMAINNFEFDSNAAIQQDERSYLPNQGIVLVEVFWEHELLTELGFNPVLTAIGSERAEVSVWAVFPLPAIRPTIQFE